MGAGIRLRDLAFTTQKGYSLINLRAGVKTADDKVGFYVIGKNVTNRHYFIGSSASSGGAYVTVGDPRVFMGQVEFKF